jgi:hypothetical protein
VPALPDATTTEELTALTLLRDLQRTFHITQRAQRIRTADRDNIRTETLRFEARSQFVELGSRVGQRIDHLHLHIKQIQQQTITVGEIIFCPRANRVFQQCHAMETKLRRDCRRLTNVVGLDCPGGDERVRPFTQCIRGQKLQLTQLVAPIAIGVTSSRLMKISRPT